MYVPALGPEHRGKMYVPCLLDLDHVEMYMDHVHRCTMSSKSVLDTSATLQTLFLLHPAHNVLLIIMK